MIPSDNSSSRIVSFTQNSPSKSLLRPSPIYSRSAKAPGHSITPPIVNVGPSIDSIVLPIFRGHSATPPCRNLPPALGHSITPTFLSDCNESPNSEVEFLEEKATTIITQEIGEAHNEKKQSTRFLNFEEPSKALNSILSGSITPKARSSTPKTPEERYRDLEQSPNSELDYSVDEASQIIAHEITNSYEKDKTIPFLDFDEPTEAFNSILNRVASPKSDTFGISKDELHYLHRLEVAGPLFKIPRIIGDLKENPINLHKQPLRMRPNRKQLGISEKEVQHLVEEEWMDRFGVFTNAKVNPKKRKQKIK